MSEWAREHPTDGHAVAHAAVDRGAPRRAAYGPEQVVGNAATFSLLGRIAAARVSGAATGHRPIRGLLIQRCSCGAAPENKGRELAPVDVALMVGSTGGHPLDCPTRAYFEPRFGRALDDVRVHSNPGAARAARDLRAQAFTTGSDIYFAAGRYAPQTAAGQFLLAHELTHVVQQREGPGAQLQPSSEEIDAGWAEVEADRVATHVVSCGPDTPRPSISAMGPELQCTPEDEPRRSVPAGCHVHSIPESGRGAPARLRYRVHVCVNTNELFVEELAPPHRRVFHSLVVTGGEGTPTPKGTFRLGPWERDFTTPRWGKGSCTPWSERPGFNVFGPYISRFHDGYFLHGTLFPWVVSMGWIDVASAFGGSHGCVRMNNVDLGSLHDGLLSNPAGTTIIIEDCPTPAEASGELRLIPSLTLGTGEGRFELGYRRFTPTLLGRHLQPFVGGLIGTGDLGLETGLTVEPWIGIGAYLEGRAGVRTEWFTRVELGAGAEVGLALGHARALRLGVGWDYWHSLTDGERRHVLSFALGLRF